jgi:hypothetical protein
MLFKLFEIVQKKFKTNQLKVQKQNKKQTKQTGFKLVQTIVTRDQCQ